MRGQVPRSCSHAPKSASCFPASLRAEPAPHSARTLSAEGEGVFFARRPEGRRHGGDGEGAGEASAPRTTGMIPQSRRGSAAETGRNRRGEKVRVINRGPAETVWTAADSHNVGRCESRGPQPEHVGRESGKQFVASRSFSRVRDYRAVLEGQAKNPVPIGFFRTCPTNHSMRIKGRQKTAERGRSLKGSGRLGLAPKSGPRRPRDRRTLPVRPLPKFTVASGVLRRSQRFTRATLAQMPHCAKGNLPLPTAAMGRRRPSLASLAAKIFLGFCDFSS